MGTLNDALAEITRSEIIYQYKRYFSHSISKRSNKEDAENDEEMDNFLIRGKLKIFFENTSNSAEHSISKHESKKRSENSFAFDINKYSLTFERACTIDELESDAFSHFYDSDHPANLSTVSSSVLPIQAYRVDKVPCVHSSEQALLEFKRKSNFHRKEIAPILPRTIIDTNLSPDSFTASTASKGDFPCTLPDCNKSFSSRTNMLRHIRTAHDKSRPYQCQECHSFWPTPSELKAHIASHSNEKCYRCESCKIDYKTSSNLHKHMRTHGQLLAFQCCYCPASFSTELSLNCHKGHRHKSQILLAEAKKN